MTLKERIALALAQSNYDVTEDAVERYTEMAQAALEAMLDLPDNLIRVGGMEVDELWSQDCDDENALAFAAFIGIIKAAIAER